MAAGKKQAAVDDGTVEGPWDLPGGWRWERLGDCYPLEYGKSLPARHRSEGGTVPVYGSSGDVGRHDIALTDGPTLIVGRKGSAGAVHYCETACWPIDTAYFVKPRDGMNLRYAYHLLSYLQLGNLDQSTAIPSLSRDNYSDLIVPIADQDVQPDIVARIDVLFAQIDAGEAELADALAGVETYRRSLLKAAVTGKLTADWRRENPARESGKDLYAGILASHRERWRQDDKKSRKTYLEPNAAPIEKLPVLPDGWTWATLSQICDVNPTTVLPRPHCALAGPRRLCL